MSTPGLSEEIKNAYLSVAMDRSRLHILEIEITRDEDNFINGIYDINDNEYIRISDFNRWYRQQLLRNIELGLIYANQIARDSGLNPEDMITVQNYAFPHDYIIERAYEEGDREDVLPFWTRVEDAVNCDIDFSRVRIVELNVDLSDKWDILSRNTYVIGNDYYCVSINLTPELARGRPLQSVEYYGINELQNYVRYNRDWTGFNGRCKHPIYNTSISLENITRFTYRGPVQGGKSKYKRSYINKNKTKKSIKKRLYR